MKTIDFSEIQKRTIFCMKDNVFVLIKHLMLLTRRIIAAVVAFTDLVVQSEPAEM
ncbi:hypothetical protein J7E38_04025 [Bacillus sp. ISL-35]|uniref:hypothetical protein n=1 Tax=Bacillus sp. ISL-35 TaxID=2819122 RepID=UPI001BE5C796|nr:hypothetical protein [Bacillus sp. ISL-35]MBT2678154.1 hypothetical protein [Bacillus sp. ISL-35]MBT2702559.1 hypothetical protein [Chryseobacterium sp. ISL-80]